MFVHARVYRNVCGYVLRVFKQMYYLLLAWASLVCKKKTRIVCMSSFVPVVSAFLKASLVHTVQMSPSSSCNAIDASEHNVSQPL